jgi:hypothetical protein
MLVWIHAIIYASLGGGNGCAQVRIRFDSGEALRELGRLGLLEGQPLEGDGRAEGRCYMVVRPSKAVDVLKLHWKTHLQDRLSAEARHLDE